MAGTGHAVAFSDLVAPHRAAGWRRRGRGRCSIIPTSPRPASAGRSSTPTRGPGFIGLSSGHRFPDLLRAVVEGLGFAARDCYAAMGALPRELRLTGGAARSRALRAVLAGAVQAPVRVSGREEAGAAGAAMMAAVAVGAYPSMDACIARWVTPLLGPAEAPDPELVGDLRPAVPGLRRRARRAGAGLGGAGRARRRRQSTADRPRRPWHPKGARHDGDGHGRPSGDRRRHQRRRDRARRGRAGACR